MMKIKHLLIATLLISCNETLDTWDGYEISKGDHHSQRTGLGHRVLGLQAGRHLKFKAQFNANCLYPPENSDVNKLYGFCDANSRVHENSARFGWRHNGKGTIEIFAYWYSAGVVGSRKLGTTLPETPDEYEIWARNGFYYFRFNDQEFKTSRSVDSEHGVRVRLWPYFGGDTKAPNDMLILIYESR